MLKNSHTKVIVPVITLALVRVYAEIGKLAFSDSEVRSAYEKTVLELKKFLGHDVHIGAKYYDAYGSRMSRYGVLKQVAHLKYRLLKPFTTDSEELCQWIPSRIKQHIDARLGVVPSLSSAEAVAALAHNREEFLALIGSQISKTPANFEIFSFAVVKVHLEKFACKIYRDSRTSAHDHGVDFSTNFGVVYQIKKLRIRTESDADKVCAELKLNFDKERLSDGNVILVIDDISKDLKQYLVRMSVKSLTKEDLVNIASNFEEFEDRQRVLQIVYEEFRREYSSRIS